MNHNIKEPKNAHRSLRSVWQFHEGHRRSWQDGIWTMTQDPYLLVSVGGESKKTTTQNGAGKTPKWPDILTFFDKGNILKVQVKDDDVGADDHVGEGVFDIAGAYSNPNKPATCKR
jgi:hypothetical protein